MVKKNDMSILKYILLLFICLLQNLLFAQKPYYFEPITANNGLPHQTIYRILQDKKALCGSGHSAV